MPNVSHFETLTERYVLVQQRTETLFPTCDVLFI